MLYLGQTPAGTHFALSHVADRVAGTNLRFRDELITWPFNAQGQPAWAASLTRDVTLIDRFSQCNKSLELRGAANRVWLIYDGEPIASVDFQQMLAYPKGAAQPAWAHGGSMLVNELPDDAVRSGLIICSPEPGKCGRCGSADKVVPIQYGYPSPESLERERRGEIQCGGCCLTPWSPKWHCKACNLDF
jgi:hypothetical protein